jgi:hypothetical protein
MMKNTDRELSYNDTNDTREKLFNDVLGLLKSLILL